MNASTVKDELRRQWIEMPSWAFGNSGTRFKVFAQAGVARTPFQKIDDAAQVLKYTGVARSVSLHIPLDLVGDFSDLRSYSEVQGLKLGAIIANVFPENDYIL